MKSALPLAAAILFAAVAQAQTDAPVITRAPITADEKAAVSSTDTADLADLRAQNKKLGAELAAAWKENDRLKTYALGQVAAANQKAEAADARTSSAADSLTQNQADLDAKNKEVAALRSQLADAQKSIDDLRKTGPAALATAQDELAAQTQKVADLQAERDNLAQKLSQALAAATPAPTPAATVPESDSDSPDFQKLAADAQDKLNMSLRAYTVLQDETDQLKDKLATTTDEKASLAGQLDDAKHLADDRQASLNQQAQQLASLQAAAATDGKNIAALHDQLRQMQNLVAQLAGENSDLKTRLVLDAPTSSASTPSRYEPAPAPEFAPPPPGPATAPATPSPAEAGPRTYKVASGDTLAKISKQFYGTSTRWQEILEANHDKLRDDKSLRIGMELKIP
jgi:nucleoid-associated protein YgaU